jgi:hypothetical protein
MSRQKNRIPTGFRRKAQGCDAGAPLGTHVRGIINRNAVAAALRGMGRNRVAVGALDIARPRVARASRLRCAPAQRAQPWAGGHNPLGIG